jgi:DNA adenine methylase
VSTSRERSSARSARSSRPGRSLRRRDPAPVRVDVSLERHDDHPKPFLKWAGGKRQLLPAIRRFYPQTFGAYIEPFVGSGAVFFDLAAQQQLDGRRVVLADVNPDVVGVFGAVKSQLPKVLHELEQLALEHARDGADCYYDVRDKRFNPLRAATVAAVRARHRETFSYPPQLAAMLIYLNRTGFNGLFRLNSRGLFNVPAGRYANPRICDHTTLGLASRILKSSKVDLRFESFERVLDHAGTGDFVYFDPPYAPLSPTSNFTSYTEHGFDEADQRELRDVVVTLARRGAHVLASNSTAPLIRELYSSPEARRAGIHLHLVPARRAINSRASARGQVFEYLISNIAPRS